MKLSWFKILCFLSLSLCAEEYVLCIDGGGSKTTLQVVDERGELVTLIRDKASCDQVETIGSNINVVGIEGVNGALHALFENTKLNGHVPLVDLLGSCRVVAGMSGAGSSQNKESITTLFETWGIDREKVFVTSDAELAVKLVGDRGVVLICGTGSICFAKNGPDLFRAGGLGRVLGDEGSGYQIGLEALKAALAEEYGWGSPTRLTQALKEFFNVDELKELIPQINMYKMHSAEIARCVPLVFEKAWKGDPVAEEIVQRAAKDLSSLLIASIKISRLSDCEVHLWGGVFKSQYAGDFIQKIMDQVDCVERNLRFFNDSQHTPAQVFVSRQSKFFVVP